MASPIRWRRLIPGPALAIAAALAAVGCASATAGTRATSAAAADHGTTSLTTAQARQVFGTYVATTAKAIRTDNDSLALSVVTGAQRAVVSAAAKSHGGHIFSVGFSTGSGAYTTIPGFGPVLGPYTYGTPTFYLPEPAGYPRFFVADATRALKGFSPADRLASLIAGAQVPLDGQVLMVFEQSSASSSWLLASTSQLPVGATVPRLATDKNGYVPQVPLTSTGLLAQPYATGPLQAAVVDDGPTSAAAKAVAAGSLTTSLYADARSGSGSGLQAPRGDIYQWAMQGTAYPAFALRTADGGALVLYAMYLNNTVAVPSYIDKANPITPGPRIEIPPDLESLLPNDQPNPTVELESQQTLSFAAIDPPAGASKIQVIAIGGGLNYATAT